MPNKIKSSGTTTKKVATRNTNFKIGVDGSDDYGPTNITGFYNGITPPTSGYTIYVHRVSGGPAMHIANNDEQCIFFLKSFGATGETINEVLSWSTGRTDMWVQTSDLTLEDLDSPSGGDVISDGLFLHLDASDYTTGTWNDKTANGNNATINGATWLSDNGGIFDLDGINDNIQIPHNSNLSLSTSVQKTIQVWVKFDSLGSTSTEQIPVFGKLSSSFGFDGYWGGLFGNTGNTRVTTNGTGIQRVTTSTTNPISINTWYLYTFISQITSTSNTTKVYINTTEVSSTAHGNDGYGETNPLYLGFIGSGIGSLYLNGKIGACYFYTKGLSSSEITDNFNNTKSKYGL